MTSFSFSPSTYRRTKLTGDTAGYVCTCGGKTKVTDTRRDPLEHVRRRRVCTICNKIIHTIELLEEDMDKVRGLLVADTMGAMEILCREVLANISRLKVGAKT